MGGEIISLQVDDHQEEAFAVGQFGHRFADVGAGSLGLSDSRMARPMVLEAVSRSRV